MELIPAVLTVPERLTPSSVAAFDRALQQALAEAAPVVVLRGATAGTFSLGLAIDAADDGTTSARAFAEVLARLHAAPKPLLAAVDGAAIGGGLGLACACDWVVATPASTFGLPELLWGLLPAMIWPVVTDRMAPHVARQWTLAAHTRRADEAQAAGVVDDLVAADRLDAAIRRGVRLLARLEPSALPRFRAWARESRTLTLPAAVAAGAEITGQLMRDPAVQGRWRAFAEGDAPWSA